MLRERRQAYNVQYVVWSVQFWTRDRWCVCNHIGCVSWCIIWLLNRYSLFMRVKTCQQADWCFYLQILVLGWIQSDHVNSRHQAFPLEDGNSKKYILSIIYTYFCRDLHACRMEMRFFKHCFVTWRKSCVVEASEEDNNIIFPWQFQFCAALSLVFCPWHQWFVLHFRVTKGANRLASNLSVQEKMDKRFPDFHMIIPNVTYLFWLNCFGLRLNCFFPDPWDKRPTWGWQQPINSVRNLLPMPTHTLMQLIALCPAGDLESIHHMPYDII